MDRHILRLFYFIVCLSCVIGGQAIAAETETGAIEDQFSIKNYRSEVRLNLRSNDLGRGLQIESVSSPQNGTVINLGDSIIYKPQTEFTGLESFSYVVVDAAGEKANGLISIVVNSAATQWRVMPIGDSITEATGSQDSYRRPLWHLLNDAGFETEFVGSRSGNFTGQVPNPDFDTDHEGHWGWRTDQILVEISTWTQAHQPDVALVHLGTNDLALGNGVASTTDELSQLIDMLRAENPDIIILLSQIIPITGPIGDLIVDLNVEISALAASKSTIQSPVLVVDQHSGFDAAVDTYDGVHPNLAGETKMADRWFALLGPAINEPPVFDSSIPNVSVSVGETVKLDFSAYISDPEAQQVTYSTSALPTGLTRNDTTGVVSGVPTTPGVTTVDAVVTDNYGASAQDTFTITVNPPAPQQSLSGGGGSMQSIPNILFLLLSSLIVVIRVGKSYRLSKWQYFSIWSLSSVGGGNLKRTALG